MNRIPDSNLLVIFKLTKDSFSSFNLFNYFVFPRDFKRTWPRTHDLKPAKFQILDKFMIQFSERCQSVKRPGQTPKEKPTTKKNIDY